MTDDSAFALHPQLEGDCFPVTEAPLCRVLLMNDKRFPWLILVPRRAGIEQIHQLDDGDRTTLMSEIAHWSELLLAETGMPRINVAALGSQLRRRAHGSGRHQRQRQHHRCGACHGTRVLRLR